jgi:hypothetical protein
MACCVEAHVGYPTAYAVLFQGKVPKSPATLRAAAWAKAAGIHLGSKQPTKAETSKQLDAIEAELDQLLAKSRQ